MITVLMFNRGGSMRKLVIAGVALVATLAGCGSNGTLRGTYRGSCTGRPDGLIQNLSLDIHGKSVIWNKVWGEGSGLGTDNGTGVVASDDEISLYRYTWGQQESAAYKLSGN